MVCPEVKVMLDTSLDIEINYASTAIRFSVRMDQIPIVLRKFVRIAA